MEYRKLKMEDKKKRDFRASKRASGKSHVWCDLGPQGEYSESGPTQLWVVPFCPGGSFRSGITSERNDPSWANPFLARVSVFVRQVYL